MKYNNNYPNKELINLSLNSNKSIIEMEKEELLKYISKTVGKNITSVKSLFLKNDFNFGNQFIILAKAIYYCEILGCKRILLDKESFWYIKNKIIVEKNKKMIIKVGKEHDIKNSRTLIDNTFNLFYYKYYIKPELRVEILKKEILKNLPLVKIDRNDLYIYIRSGDLFININPNKNYSQPPLCFYKKILNNFKFKKIYIIAENNNNPIIDELISLFPNIKYQQNSLELDISFLVNAYNLVEGKSTFFTSIIQLNDNIQFLWKFDFHFNKQHINNSLEEIINSFPVSKKKIIIFKMKASNIYRKKMLFWNNTHFQRDLMLKSKCPNNFRKIIHIHNN